MAEWESDRPMLTIGRGWAVYIGPVESGRLHRHQAAQLAWSPQGVLSLEGAWGVLETPGHFLPAGVPHRLAGSHSVRMLFLDPAILRSSHSLGLSATAAALTAPQISLLEDELDRWLRGEGTTTEEPPSDKQAADPRWTAVLHWLDQALDGPVRVQEAADAVGLSPSRFMHWFVKASGLSFRAHVRWLRLQQAVRTLSNGSTLTEAAHLAGFADSAHLTRTFVATFGVRPAPLRTARVVCSPLTVPPLTPPVWLSARR